MACQMSLYLIETDQKKRKGRRRRRRFLSSNLSSLLPMESQLHGKIPYISSKKTKKAEKPIFKKVIRGKKIGFINPVGL